MWWREVWWRVQASALLMWWGRRANPVWAWKYSNSLWRWSVDISDFLWFQSPMDAIEQEMDLWAEKQ